MLASGATAVDQSKVHAALVAESDALAPGRSATIAVTLKHEPHWHTYWINPGDSGQATKLKWTLPEGVTVRTTHWPAPRRFDAGGGIVNFVYEDEAWVLVDLDVPAGFDAKSASLALQAQWLECTTDICVPGGAKLALELPVAAKSAPRRDLARAFEEARARIPQPLEVEARGGIVGRAAEIVLPGPGLPEGTAFDAFALQPAVLESAAPRIARQDDALYVSAQSSDYLDAVPASLTLVLTQPTAQGPRAWQVEVPLITAPGGTR